MFYLTQFCRICVQSKCEMQHIDGDDYDAIKFSVKLQRICQQLVISEQDHSRVICNECIQRLRISYAFHKMCSRSDRLLQQYLDELTGGKTGDETFNSELRVTIVPIPRIQITISSDGAPQADNRLTFLRTNANSTLRLRRKLKSEASFRISDAYRERLRKLCHNKLRITKEKRCIILRHLLQKEGGKISKDTQRKQRTTKRQQAGGLRDLLSFIRDYDFGFVINECDIQERCDPSALDRLQAFSNTFFFTNFDDYRNTILAVAESSDDEEEEDMFGPFDEREDRQLWSECRKEDSDTEEQLLVPSEFVQTCYEEEKQEEEDEEEEDEARLRYKINMAFQKRVKKHRKHQKASLPKISIIPEASTSTSLTSLDWLTTRLTNDAKAGKTMSPHHVRCRTRGNPFINPQLMQQFQMRTFRCDTCNRSFKSPGYLHSHCTKMGH